MLAPAMNQQMWKDPATEANIQTLRSRGVQIVGPTAGQQACGDIGLGRMEDPAAIAQAAANLFSTGLLAGKRVVITAGPTREALDPVRYISNNSSGKMGYALAQAAIDAGAITALVSGPVNLRAPDHARVFGVQSAQEMLEQCLNLLPDCDIFIASAAVADYRPETVAREKIKKGPAELTLSMVRTVDIIAAVAASKHPIYTVGFAAETSDVLAYAKDKMQRKGLDMIIANDVSDASIGFNSDDNAVTLLWPDDEQALSRANKHTIARQIVQAIALKTQRSS
jgi:phosphopantothenoylcysteine decarboxylase/phosphopantothenate--cysteine ligase